MNKLMIEIYFKIMPEVVNGQSNAAGIYLPAKQHSNSEYLNYKSTSCEAPKMLAAIVER
jgi:hypothetical protein